MRIRPPGSRLRSRILTLTAAAAALLATAACGAGSQGSSADATTLSLAVQGAPNSLDPAQLVEGQQAYVWNSVYDTLLYADNKGRLQPNAATSWNYSDDARTLTLKLRQGMAFSSGAKVNAAAVKATLERSIATPGPNRFKFSSIASVQAPDDLTVVIKLKKPDGALLSSLSMAAGVIGDPATLNDPATKLTPVGSGPYVLDKAATVNGSTYVLKRRNDYWNAKAFPFETVKIRVIADRTATANALQAGELNAGTAEVNHLARLKAAGFGSTLVQAITTGNLVMVDREGEVLKPLGDVRVRKAINMAFDRPKIVQQLLRGAGKPTVQQFNPKGPAYDPALEQTYSYDPAGAKKLMAEAGYAGGFSVKMPSFIFTKPFEPTITQSLADIGIKVTWDPVPPQNNVAALSSKKYPMFFMLEGLNIAPVEVRLYAEPDGFRNTFGTEDPRLSKLLDQANREQDPARSADLYKKINAFLVQNAWNAPVFYVGANWVTKGGVTYLGDGSLTFQTIRAFGVSG
ncbi:ABC transporter substrate-binding protein [Spirillospora sp. CA-255316]